MDKRLRCCPKPYAVVNLQAPQNKFGSPSLPVWLVGCATRGEGLPELSRVCPPADSLQEARGYRASGVAGRQCCRRGGGCQRCHWGGVARHWGTQCGAACSRYVALRWPCMVCMYGGLCSQSACSRLLFEQTAHGAALYCLLGVHALSRLQEVCTGWCCVHLPAAVNFNWPLCRLCPLELDFACTPAAADRPASRLCWTSACLLYSIACRCCLPDKHSRETPRYVQPKSCVAAVSA